MLLTRFRSLMLVLLCLGSGVSTALAQPASGDSHLPYPPADLLGDYQLFAPADLSTYGNGRPQASEGIFVNYNRLAWWMGGPKTSLVGNASAAGTVPVNVAGQAYIPDPFGGPAIPVGPNNVSALTVPNLNSLDNSFVQSEDVWGNRYEIGYVKDDRGWMVGATFLRTYNKGITQVNANIVFGDPSGLTSRYLDLNQDGVQDDLDGDGIFGNTGPYNVNLFWRDPANGVEYYQSGPLGQFDNILDRYVGPDSGDLRNFPVVLATLFAENNTQYSSAEIMHIIRWNPLHDGANMEWIAGLRYANVHDNFRLLGQATGGAVQEFRTQVDINNYIVGPQVGVRWNKAQGRWGYNLEGRFVAGANFQQVNLDGSFRGSGGALTGITPGLIPTDPVSGASFLSFIDAESSVQFSPIGELRLDMNYRLTNKIVLTVGYTGTVIGGITRASRRIDYELPGTYGGGVVSDGIRINDDNRLESFWMSGINFGLEINR